MAAGTWNAFQAQQQAGNSMVVFINDDSAVANYPVQAGYTVALINVSDPENSRMYLKSVESNGMPNPTRIFKIEDITPRHDGDSVSRKEFDALNRQYEDMCRQYGDMSRQLKCILDAISSAGNNAEKGAKGK